MDTFSHNPKTSVYDTQCIRQSRDTCLICVFSHCYSVRVVLLQLVLVRVATAESIVNQRKISSFSSTTMPHAVVALSIRRLRALTTLCAQAECTLTVPYDPFGFV
jgi:hypothetical protein